VAYLTTSLNCLRTINMILIANIALVVADVIIISMVVFAMVNSSGPKLNDEENTALPRPPIDVLQAAYTAATQLHIETDRAMWQIVAIYVPVSVLIMGWVVSSMNVIKETSVIIAASSAIVLVGIATLFKHRLRSYNKVREAYLRRLENVLMGSEPAGNQWGLHHVMLKNFNSSACHKSLLSIHCVVDLYFFLHILIWIALWIVIRNSPPVG